MSHQALLGRIHSAQARVGVIGLGYVGLPLVREFCRAGFSVIGFDVDATKVESLLAGRSYIRHIPDGLVGDLVGSGRFRPTADYNRIPECDAVLICVPTPLTPQREPDISYVQATAESIGRQLRRGQLIVLESTTYPGTTDEVVRPILERASGLAAGADYYLAYSPEREDPGNRDFSTGTIPKVVGGHDGPSGELAAALYGKVVPRVVSVSTTRVAESAKILENMFRAVNIALVNELKVLFTEMGIDVWEVIEAAATKPFGFMPFYPGPGLGGHCIPIDPFYLTWKAREFEQSTRFIELAGEINSSMPRWVVQRVAEALNERGRALKGAKVLVLGIAYKPNVDDDRESPSLHIIDLLKGHGAEVSYNDPYIPRLRRSRRHDLGLSSVQLTDEALADQDCVLVATDHGAYDWDRIVAGARLVVDTRNATRRVTEGRERIVKA
ncbi:MAG: nucleotide sugar dehydrogenase [Planctomycetes bacterium]|nr:nucleotide sugar dehydrogenase [Planctomycetota bacterium]